jgi:dihydrodipicolinate synthase/N-acetylneuraminate lyase
MKRGRIEQPDLRGVFSVPPIARRRDVRRSIDFDACERVVRHIAAGGISRFTYGGNAFLYHITLAEYEALLEWLAAFPADRWAIPSLGPSFGRALDQAPLLARHSFPCAMLLPCSDPRDAAGLERGIREMADLSGAPLILYLKDEAGFGADRAAGLDAVGRLVRDGVCVGIKYAVVRAEPRVDAYLEGLLERVDAGWVISGIGERPAVVHMRDWGLPGFTTGSGCIAPSASQRLYEACARGDFARAEELRARFLEVEDLRDALGPARVLHAATELAGIATTGAIPPYVTELSEAEHARLAPASRSLLEYDRQVAEASLAASRPV